MFVHDPILLGWLNGEGRGGRAYVTHEQSYKLSYSCI
jgi:hypothetical protein